MDRPRLCRRELQDLGQPVRYCGKPIKRANPLDWCEDDRARLPIWPTDEKATPTPVSADEFQEAA